MIEVRIPKEIRTYKEKLFFGLNVRQTICSVLAIAINVPLYIFIRPHIGDQIASWLIIFTAGPLFLIGFFHYNGMPFEQFIICIMKFMFLIPQKRKYKVENLYAVLLDLHEKEIEWRSKSRTNLMHRMFSKKKQTGGGESIGHS
ncbi:MAG: PrgI family protein [Clostridia bacterium]|nr:PrgI family protein [Clostridia bacterium]